MIPMHFFFALFTMHILDIVSADQTLASLKYSKIPLVQDRALFPDNCIGNRLRGGSGGVGLESGRNEMIKRARSFELVRVLACQKPEW
jgi:hypothetical protein